MNKMDLGPEPYGPCSFFLRDMGSPLDGLQDNSGKKATSDSTETRPSCREAQVPVGCGCAQRCRCDCTSCIHVCLIYKLWALKVRTLYYNVL